MIRYADGTYRSTKYANISIGRAIKYRYLEDAKDAADDLNRLGRKCEIIPIRVTIREIKKRELLCYFTNPIYGNGWELRADESMKHYWLSIMPYDGCFGALTD